MRRACVMGHNIAYSRSPLLHGYWLKTLGIAGAYELKDLAPREFPSFFTRLREHGYVGGNITKPHKEAAFDLVHRREPAAASIGAVNTVWYENGALVGGNTDWMGIVQSLDDIHPGWDRAAKETLVLGAGGAARAAVYGLLDRGLRVTVVNRTRARADELVEHFGARTTAHAWEEIETLLPRTDLLINATMLGMRGEPPLEIGLARLKAEAIVYDIVYAPLETALLRDARRSGRRTVDGLSMLLYQAVPGFAHWFGVTPKVTPGLRALIEADIRKSEGA